MSLKDKITSILFSQKSKEEMGEESLAQQVENEPESQENLSFASVDETVLKLPADHPLAICLCRGCVWMKTAYFRRI